MSERRVCVRERGQTDVASDTWAVLSEDREFRRLLEGGILTATLLPHGRTRLQGACYVGWVRCGDVEIEIQEKVPGALKTLLSYATNTAFRIEHLQSPASDLGALTVLLIQQFLSAVTEYASRAREFVYERQRRVGSLAGGRIDIAASVQLRARGLGHLLAFDKDIVSFKTPLNRVVLAALMEVERLARVIDVGAEDVAAARGLALLFHDCRDVEVLFGDRSLLVRAASDLATSGRTLQLRDIAGLASALLAHESFERRTATWREVPRAWFLNLERLFEHAVISELRGALPGTNVAGAGEGSRGVFRGERKTYGANPDIVVTGSGGRVTVGDVKYKNWTGEAVASDIYQLLVHTAAFAGTVCFLVYPHDEYQAISLGEAVTGTNTWLFALDVRNLGDGVARMADTLGLDASMGAMPSGQSGVAGAP